jgi:hypothetical protein
MPRGSNAKAAPAPAPRVEPSIDIDEPEDAANEAESAPDPSTTDQKLFKIKDFIDILKKDYPEAKRFNIYFFSDRVQTIDSPWNDNAPTIYLKPALITVSPQSGKVKVLTNDVFNTKFNTTDWGISFSQSKMRAIDTSVAVNILKVLPEVKKYSGYDYYRSMIMKPDATEQKLATIIERSHDQFPVFKKTYQPPQDQIEVGTDCGLEDIINICF